jgi:TonB family protein
MLAANLHPIAKMPQQSRTIFAFPLLLLNIFSFSNILSASQLDSNKQTLASDGQTSVSRASCAYQSTEVLVLRTPGISSPIDSVKCDEELTIIYNEVGYYKVKIRNGKQGYISRLFVTNTKQAGSNDDENHEGILKVGQNGITPPACTHCPDPKYTPEARSAKYQGNVVLEANITTDGRAANVRAIRVTTIDQKVVGIPNLDRAWVSLEETAIESVKKWEFKPSHGTDGKPVVVRVPIEISFRLLY